MRTLTVVLAVLTLGACHKHENPAGSGSAGSAQPATNAAPAPVPPPTIDAAVAGGPDPWASGSGSGDGSSAGSDSASGSGSGSDAAPHRKLGKDVMEKEKIHDLALGDSMAAAEKQLGKPDSRSKPEEVEATGDTTQTWKYGASEVTFKKDKGGWTLLSVHVMPPTDWTTSQGIHIGSTKAEVQAGYKGKADAESFLVGSEYGGELFRLEGGKVTEIFLGAMAE